MVSLRETYNTAMYTEIKLANYIRNKYTVAYPHGL